jgi:hypothetical protein
VKKVLISIAALGLIIGSFLALSYFDFSDTEGTITITLIDEIGDIISNKDFDFNSEDTLFDLLNKNYELGCTDSGYRLSTLCEPKLVGSRVLLKIDDLETDWINSYIAIYENGEYSVLGIDYISINDGDTFIFEYKLVGGDN